MIKKFTGLSILLFLLSSILCNSHAQELRWEQSGPYSKSYLQVARSHTSSTLYAIDSTSMYRSFDDGEHWQIDTAFFQSFGTSLRLLEFVITDSSYVFSCIMNGAPALFRTDTTGWVTNIESRYNASPVVGFAQNRHHAIYAYSTSGRFGVIRTTDRGVTWDSCNTGLPTRRIAKIAVSFGDSIVVETDSGLFRSVFPEANWTRVPESGNRKLLGVAPNGSLYASNPVQLGGGTYNLPRDSTQWSLLTTVTGTAIAFVGDAYCILGSNVGAIYVSSNSGASWMSTGNQLSPTPIRQLQSIDLNVQFVYTSLGTRRSTDLGTYWDAESSYCPSTKIALAPANGYLYGGFNHFVRSTNLGRNWSAYPLPDTTIPGAHIEDVCASNTGRIFVSIYPDGVYEVNDSGTGWRRLNWPFQSGFTYSLVTDSSGNLYAYNPNYSRGVYRWDDSTNQWIRLIESIQECVLFTSGDSTIFCLGSGQLRRSTNRGVTWTSHVFTNSRPISMAVCGNGLLYFFGSLGVHRSYDNGDSWEQVSTIPIQGYGTGSANQLGHLFFCVDTLTPHRSTDGGVTWHPLADGWLHQNGPMGFNHFPQIVADRNGIVYATTSHHGILRATTSSTPVAESRNAAVPVSSELTAVYPNPFNNIVTIHFRVNHPDRIRIRIFDLLGREVAVVTEGKFHAGYHHTQWKPASLASGQYFLEFQSSDNHSIRKIALLK